MEEVGARIKITDGPYIKEWIDPDKRHTVTFDFIAEHVGGKISNKEIDKHDEVRWFDLDELPDNVRHYTKVLERLNEILYSSF